MGFMDKIFGGKEQNENSNFWHQLNSEEDLKTAVNESYERKVVLFKHSTRCFISKTVLRNFENEAAASTKDVSYYFLDLLKNRALSNMIEEKFDVVHQSPQMIVLENGEVTEHASHQSISLSLL